MTEASKALPVVDYAELQKAWSARTYYGLSSVAWMRIGITTALLLAVFWPPIRRLLLKTNPFNGEPNWQHSFFVPLIGLYYLYLNREALLKVPVRPMLWGPFARRSRLGIGALTVAAGLVAWATMQDSELVASAGKGLVVYGVLVVLLDWGPGTMLFGILMYAYGIWPGQNDFVQHFAIVVTLFGVVLLLCGWDVMKMAWFPIAFLVCAIPWPPLVYSWIAMPLQQLAASAAVGTLRATGVEALRKGTKLFIGEGDQARVLNVAEACAGLKSLMTFITLAAAVAFLSTRAMWQKLVITFFAIPIAIFCNMMRVSGQGLLDHYVSPKLSESFAHQFVGLIMLVPAFFLIQFVAWILDNLFIEEVDKRGLSDRAAASLGKAGERVVEIPRAGAGRAARPAPNVPDPAGADLAAATARLMASTVRGGRRQPRIPPAPPTPSPATDRPEGP